MNITTKNTIKLPKEATFKWQENVGSNFKIKRTSANGITPVTFSVEFITNINTLMIDSYLYYDGSWKKIELVDADMGTFQIYASEGSWDTISTTDFVQSKWAVTIIKRTSADGVVPVVLTAINGNFVTEFIANNYIFFNAEWKKIQSVNAGAGTVTIVTAEGSWDTFSTTDIETYQWAQMGKLQYDGLSTIYNLIYNDWVDESDIAIKNYIFYNGVPNKIIGLNTETKTITLTDDVSAFPGTWTDFTWREIVNIIQNGADNFDVYFQVRGTRTENVLLYINWDYADSNELIVKPSYLGYFFKDKVAEYWYSVDEYTNWYRDTIETISANVSDFVPRDIQVDGNYDLVVPLNVPANVLWIKLNITVDTSGATSSLILDIVENAIGIRNFN